MLTPIEELHPFWAKRDDTFCYAGVYGAKARATLHIAKAAKAKGKSGLVTACNRHSLQAGIIAHVAAEQGLQCRVYVNKHVNDTPEMEFTRQAGADIIMSDCTFDSVPEQQANTFAQGFATREKWEFIPSGMCREDAVQLTADQVATIPAGVRRVVVTVGGGVTLAGVIRGLRQAALSLPVLGVVVGRDPTRTLNTFIGKHWGACTLADSGLNYEQHAADVMFPAEPGPYEQIELDKAYEAKCLPFLLPGDLLWIAGVRSKGQG